MHMKSRTMYVAGLLASILLFLAILLVHSTVLTVSNPIPAPTIILDHEYIWVYMEKTTDGLVYVNVTGMYLMRNMGFKNLTMYFPVPNETISNGEIEVYVNDERYVYEITYEMILGDRVEKYWTLYGPLPLVKWEMNNLEPFENYTVKITYTYRIKPDYGNYTFLYALGTGRFYYMYSKQCIAEIWFTLKGFRGYSFDMILADYEKQNITIVETLNFGRDEERIYKKLVSPLFTGFRRDLVVYLSKAPREDIWVPGKPFSVNIKQTRYYAENKTLIITLEMVFPNPGYKITSITKTIRNSKCIADIEILKYTGPVIQVVTRKEVTINFTGIEPGNYTIIIKINGEETIKTNYTTDTTTQTTTTTTTITTTTTTTTTPQTSPTSSTPSNEAQEHSTIVTENYLQLLIPGAITLLIAVLYTVLRK